MASPSRRSGWIIACALVACVLATVAVVLWIWLPRWAPEWVVRNSPWFDPAYRAVVEVDAAPDLRYLTLVRRILDRDWRALALARLAEDADHARPARRIDVAKLAGFWLGQRSDAGVLALAEKLLHDSHHFVRYWAIEFLPAAGRQESLPLLRAALDDPEMNNRKLACHRFVENIGGDEALAAVNKLLGDSEPEVRRQAIRAIGVMGGAGTFARLIPLFADADAETADLAAEVLWNRLRRLP